MREAVAAIMAKYAAIPPPDDYPLYGDTVVFKDKYNDRVYKGVVLRHVDNIPTFWKPWAVAVVKRITPEDTDAEFPYPEWTVTKEEIVSIVRAGKPGALTLTGDNNDHEKR